MIFRTVFLTAATLAAGWTATAAEAVFPAAAAVPATVGGEAAFERKGKRIVSTEFVELDPARKYLLTGEFRSGEGKGKLSFGLNQYDQRKRLISPHLVNPVAGTETELRRAVKKGDTELFVKDASKWKPAAGKIVAFHAELPARAIGYYITAIAPDGEEYRITLSKPVPADFAAGTPVRQHADGRDANAAWNEPVTAAWTRFEKIFTGTGPHRPNQSTFYAASRYAKIFLAGDGGERGYFRNVSFAPLDAAAEAKLTARLARAAHPPKVPGGVTRLPDPAMVKVRVKPNTAALYLAGLDWKADEIEQLEVDFSADTPGHLLMIFAGQRDGKRFSGQQVHSVIPDGQVRTLILPMKDNPAWKGTVTNLEFRLRGHEEGVIGVAAVEPVKKSNLIPAAKLVRPGEIVPLDYLLPRARYRLAWRDGENPGLTVRCFDRDGGELARVELPPGENEREFTVPELAARGELSLRGEAAGYPQITLVERIELGQPGRWRGRWIWCRAGKGPEHTSVWFSRAFELPDAPVERAALAIAADDHPFIYVNGERIGDGGSFVKAARYEVGRFLKPGRNELTIRVYNGTDEGALLCDLYVRSAGQDLFFSSDADWRQAEGGLERPAAIDQPVVDLGDPAATMPWKTRLDYRYAGPRGKIRIAEVDENGAVAEVVVPTATPALRFRGTAKPEHGNAIALQLLAGKPADAWRTGETVRLPFVLPRPTEETSYLLTLDDDYLETADGGPLGAAVFRPADFTPGFAEARFTGVGTRPKLLLDGQKRNPFFWQLPASYHRNPSAHPGLIVDSKNAGFDNYSLLTDFTIFWKDPDTFDFSQLDEQVAQILAGNPDAIFLLQIGCFMPAWWLAANPDEVARHYNDAPRNPLRDSQALASKKWLADAEKPLKALLEHVRTRPWGRRVWGANFAENRNWEWFWTILDRHNKPSVSGYSPADYATFRSYLREKYESDDALAAAWQEPGATFDTFEMPPPSAHGKGRIGALLDPGQDRKLMDYFEFRNRALAEAVIHFGRVVKETTGGRWLTGAYFGYYIEMAVNTGRAAHDHGHNGFYETATSPYVDFVRAPTRYDLRKTGHSDGIMQPQDTYSLHGKLVFIEFDLRNNFSTSSSPQGDIYVARPNTVKESVGVLNRAFGMSLAAGSSFYWYDIRGGSYREPLLIDLLREQRKIYEALPSVTGLTPKETAIVGDRDSIYYTKRNNGTDSLMPAIVGPLFRRFNTVGAPYRSLVTADLLDGDAVPPHKLYLMTNALVLSKEQRERLMRRFEREKATVLWFYAPGAFYPDRGPKGEFCADFLGLKISLVDEKLRPAMTLAPGWGAARCVNPVETGPWFFPVAGYDEVIGRDETGRPTLVRLTRNGATHYFSSLLALPPETLRVIAAKAGVHLYNDAVGDPLWIGNDVLFLHAATGGAKRFNLPPGLRLRGIAGPAPATLDSGVPFPAEAGLTYGFAVESVK